MLSASETQAAEALLGTTVRSAEPIWERNWILRLTLADGRTVILKRDRDSQDDVASFTAERAALTFLGGMDPPVAPRLLGSTDGLLLMEDLGPAVSLADSLLLRPDGDRATADLFAYARAYGAMHAWSTGRRDEFAACCPDDVPRPHWITLIARGRQPLLSVASRLGLATAGVRAELDSLGELLRGPGDAYTGLVHSDACPDNEQLTGARCRIFDFETSGWGPFALDAAYLLAPFPSCWCFAALPSSVADPALAAYQGELTRAGVVLGPDWEAALAAALGGFVVARAPALARALEADRDWGTATMRPRLLTWLSSFSAAASSSGALPRLGALASALHERLASSWPSAAVPDYPALARPGAPLAKPPAGWDSPD